MLRIAGLLGNHRDFRRFWTADAISQLGTQVSYIALPLLAIVVLHASTIQVSLLRVTQTAAILVLGLPAGAWCDRRRARPVLVTADIGRAVLLASLPLAWALHVLTIWQMYVVLALAGALTVFFNVSHQSCLPQLVGREHLVEANAKIQGNMSVAAVFGPALAGFLVQIITAPFAILADAISYVWSAAWLRSTHIDDEDRVTALRSGESSFWREISAGMRFVFGSPVLRAIACNGACAVFFQAAGTALLVLFLVRDVHLSPGGIGLLSSVGPIGAVAAAFTSRKVASRMGSARALVLTSVLSGLGALLFPLAYPGWRITYYAVGSIVCSYSVIGWNIIQVSFRQSICPSNFLGRVNGTMRFVLLAPGPVGSITGGVIGTAVGIRPVLWFSAAGMTLATLALIFSPLRNQRSLVAGPATAQLRHTCSS